MIFINLFFVFFAISEPEKKLETLQFTNGSLLKVEVANTENEKATGLMGRTYLPRNQGMLFIFKEPKKLFFWTKNTYISLSIGFFDENYILKEIHFMKPQNMMELNSKINSYQSSCHCQYAIEVNRGWFLRNKIKIGDRFLIKKSKEKNKSKN